MNMDIDKLLVLAQKLRALESDLHAESEKKRRGEPSLGRGGQVEVMLRQLRTMREQVEANDLPPSGSRVRGMAAIVVDSWPLNSRLGERLVAAEREFLKLP